MVNSLYFIYSPFPDKDSACSVAEALLKENLIVCANIMPGALSLYRLDRDSAVESSEEVLLLAKSTCSRKDEALLRLECLHPYDVPCVAVWNVSPNRAYHLWAEEILSLLRRHREQRDWFG